MKRPPAISAESLLSQARARSGLSQRALARQAKTAQSVVARIESGETSPTWSTLERLLLGAGFEVWAELVPRPILDRQELDDVGRILSLSPEERLREVANVARFLAQARRV